MFLLLLQKYWKYVLGLLMALGLAFGGYYYGQKSVKPVVQEKIVEREKIVTVEVEKKKTDKETTTTIVKNKDGSSTTTITEKEHTEQSSSTKTVAKKEKTAETKPVATAQSNYHLGLFLETDPTKVFKNPEVTWGLSGSVRIVSHVWADASFNVKTKSTKLGLSWEF